MRKSLPYVPLLLFTACAAHGESRVVGIDQVPPGSKCVQSGALGAVGAVGAVVTTPEGSMRPRARARGRPAARRRTRVGTRG